MLSVPEEEKSMTIKDKIKTLYASIMYIILYAGLPILTLLLYFITLGIAYNAGYQAGVTCP